MLYLAQLGDSILNLLLLFVFFLIFPFLQPRIMLAETLWKLERSSRLLEGLTKRGKSIVIKKISKKPSKELKERIDNFLEFFMIQPISLDPFGIVKKIEHVVNLSEKRFKYFVKTAAPDFDKETQANVIMGLSGAITLNQIAKLIRHLTELVRKTKNWQLGMVYAMQLSLIERVAKALLRGTEALTNGWPIGDSIGSLVAAHLIGNTKTREIEEDTLLARRKINGRQVLIIKARGPGGRVGKLGRAVEKLIKRERISKIVTIDAAVKFEGERTGSVAEGIGVAIGGIGVDRTYIENITTKKDIPLDSIVIKMSQEEAIQPMKKDILLSVGRAIKSVEESLARTKGKIIVVGVGNSTGVGNNKKEAEKAEKLIKKVLVIQKARKLKGKKRRLGWLVGG